MENAPMVTGVHPSEQITQRVILRHVSWETYERLLAEHEQSSSPRFTYDGGVLEIMSPSTRHERLNRRIATLCEVIAEECNIELDNVGSNTFKREDLARGFEPDSCFYVQHVERVRNREQIDLTIDPPPDLVIEIDISRSSLDRFPIFASIGVPEVWRYDGMRVAIFMLIGGAYQEQETSEAFPGVTSQIVTQFMAESTRLQRMVWLRHVRAWAHQLGGA
jgi:Uma2 family endonuclease